MTIYEILFLSFFASLPIVVLLAIGRQIVSAFRSLKQRRLRYVFYAILAITGILLLFAGMALVWFGYGVGHASKDIWHELVLISVTAILIYGASYGLWRLARFFDEKTDA